MKIKALLLDLDGTLVDSRIDLAESVRYMQTYYGAPPSSDEEVATYIGDGIGMLVARALPTFSAEKHREAVEILKPYYSLHCLVHTTIYPGVQNTLAKLAALKIGVVTNKPERVSRRILDGLGLSAFIPVVVGGDTLPEKKPNPAPLLHALKQLGDIPKNLTWMVGDSSVDVEAGRAAGIQTVGILSNIGNQEALRAARPDFLIKQFSDLASLL